MKGVQKGNEVTALRMEVLCAVKQCGGGERIRCQGPR